MDTTQQPPESSRAGRDTSAMMTSSEVIEQVRYDGAHPTRERD